MSTVIGRKATNKRRAFPIRAYVGPNGGGKSLCMVKDALPSLAAGRRVVSTVRLLGDDGLPHPLWVPLGDWRTLLDAEHCDVLLDEVTGVASARESSGLPPAIVNLLVQLRRRDVTLAFTAPAWNRAEKVLRETCQAVTLCQGFVPAAVKSVPTRHEGRHPYGWALATGCGDDEALWCPTDRKHTHDAARLWAPRRMFYWRTYDAFVFDEWTTAKRAKLKPAAREVFWRPGSRAESSYDTLDDVLSVAQVTDSGRCVDCGGSRRAAKCECPPGGHARPSSRSKRAASSADASPVDLDPVPA